MNASDRAMPFLQINHLLLHKDNSLVSAYEQRTRRAIPVEQVISPGSHDNLAESYRLWLELEPRGAAVVVVVEERIIDQKVLDEHTTEDGFEEFCAKLRAGDPEIPVDAFTQEKIEHLQEIFHRKHIADYLSAVVAGSSK